MTILRFVLILSLSANFCGRCMHFHDHDDESENISAFEQLTSSEHHDCSGSSCGCQFVASQSLRFHVCDVDSELALCDLTFNATSAVLKAADLCGPEPPRWLSSRYYLTSTVLRC